MTQDLVMIKEPSRVGSYEGMVCKIPECKERPRRNHLCVKHSKQFREGTLDLNGERTYKKVLRYSPDASCKVHRCDNRSRIVKGFCRTHYTSYKRGLIDFDGFDLGTRKRIARYSEDDLCKARGCYKKPRERGFCHNHAVARRKGYLDEKGLRTRPMLQKNVGKKCWVKDCSNPAHCKGLCRSHYSRTQRGLPPVPEFVNKGKRCEFEFCHKPAACKGYCTKHYYRLMHDRPMRRTYINKDQNCKNCQKTYAYCKGLCARCYAKYSYWAKKERLDAVNLQP